MCDQAWIYNPTHIKRDSYSEDGLQTSRFCGRRERESFGSFYPSCHSAGFMFHATARRSFLFLIQVKAGRRPPASRRLCGGRGPLFAYAGRSRLRSVPSGSEVERSRWRAQKETTPRQMSGRFTIPSLFSCDTAYTILKSELRQLCR